MALGGSNLQNFLVKRNTRRIFKFFFICRLFKFLGTKSEQVPFNMEYVTRGDISPFRQINPPTYPCYEAVDVSETFGFGSRFYGLRKFGCLNFGPAAYIFDFERRIRPWPVAASIAKKHARRIPISISKNSEAGVCRRWNIICSFSYSSLFLRSCSCTKRSLVEYCFIYRDQVCFYYYYFFFYYL